MNDPALPALLSPNAAAAILGLSRSSLFRLVRQGRLAAVRPFRELRFRRSDLEAFVYGLEPVNQHAIGSVPPSPNVPERERLHPCPVQDRTDSKMREDLSTSDADALLPFNVYDWPAAPPTTLHAESDAIDCSDYRLHQFAHRRDGERWLCPICSAASA